MLLPSAILVIGIMANAVVADSQSADVKVNLLPPANSPSPSAIASNGSSNNDDGDEANVNGLVASPLKADAASPLPLMEEGNDAVSSEGGGHSFSRDNISAALLSGGQMMAQHVHDALSAALLVRSPWNIKIHIKKYNIF